jgi:hypothetical protein
VYRADVLLRATLFETLPAVPLRPGAAVAAGDGRLTILGARCDDDACRVTVRDVGATFQPDFRTLSRVTYVLRNRRLGVALMPRTWSESLLGAGAYLPTSQHLAIRHRELLFAAPAGSTVTTDAGWLEHAVLVPLVARDLGLVTRPLVIPDFGARLAAAAEEAGPTWMGGQVR